MSWMLDPGTRTRRNLRRWTAAHLPGPEDGRTRCGEVTLERVTSVAPDGARRCGRCIRLSTNPKTCQAEGCGRGGRLERGLCRAHSTRLSRTGEIGESVVRAYRREAPCSEPGCSLTTLGGGRGLCRKHYVSKSRRSDWVPDERTASRAPSGSSHYRWVGDAASYTLVHARLTKMRGRADTHLCTHCRDRAQEWAYDYTVPNPRVSDLGSPYSVDLWHYLPLCIPCHKSFDAANREQSCGY